MALILFLKMVVALTIMLMLPSCIESLLYAAHFFCRWSASVSMKKESQSNHITCNGVENMCAALLHWRSMLFWCHKLPNVQLSQATTQSCWPFAKVSRRASTCTEALAIACHQGYFMHPDVELISPGSSSQSEWRKNMTSVPVSTGCCLPHTQELPWTMLVVVSSQSGRWARLWRVELCPWSHVYKDVGIIWTTCWRAMNFPATMIHVLEA